MPSRVQQGLATLGFSSDISPEPAKNFWDTFAILSFVAEVDQVGFLQMEKHSAWFEVHPDVVHFGNTSHPSFDSNPPCSPHHNGWGYRSIGAYYWRLSLESIDDFLLKQQYLDNNPSLPPCEDMRKILLKGGVSVEQIDSIDSIFSKNSC